jgi:hypothetical protein
VHVLLDVVLRRRRADMIRHLLHTLVEPGGRLLVSQYQAAGGSEPTAHVAVRELGFDVAGSSFATVGATTAWLIR